jgi:nucleoside-diphosphate-sugar epimerase
MKYLIIGGAGFIGSHIVDKLCEKHQVTIMDNLVSGSRSFVNKKARFIWGDIRSKEDLKRVFKNQFDRVINLAAQPYIPDCYDDPELFFETNATGTLNVLLFCEEYNIPLLQYASAEEYGTQQGLINEDTPVKPQSTYGVSKLAADYLCKIRSVESPVSVISLRQFNCYGPRETHAYVIPEIISQLHKGKTIYLGNLASQRDFLYVNDAAGYAIELLEHGVWGETYNLGSGECISIKDLALLIAKIWNKPIEIKVDPKKLRPWDIQRLQSDNTKIHQVVSYRPQTKFKEGLYNTIKYYEQYGWHFY